MPNFPHHNDSEGNWVETAGCLVFTIAAIGSVTMLGLFVWLIIEVIQWIGRH